MERDRITDVEVRVANLERRLELIDYRLRSIEHWRSAPASSQGHEPESPYPVASSPLPPPVIWQTSGEERTPPVQAPTAAKRDTEYLIGAKLLPKFGAGIVLLGVLYFVAWGYSAGWITPWMVFWGEILFCLGFIVVGQRLRSATEQYGQVLTGIGSCGLYFSVAGGALVQRILPDLTLLSVFLLISLGNLFYGLWSKSRAFLAIGIIGGLATSVLPMRHDLNSVAAINLAIVAPAALIAGRRKWADMAGWLWLFSFLALVPLLDSSASWQLRVAVLYAGALLSVGAYVYAHSNNAFDPEGILPPIMLVVTALTGLSVQNHAVGALHLVAFGLGIGVLSLLNENQRGRVLTIGLAVPLTIAPACFKEQSPEIYVALSFACFLVGIGTKRVLAAVLGVLEFALALGAYWVVESWRPLLLPAEASLLIGFMACAVAGAFALVRSGWDAKIPTIAVAALMMALFGRLGLVTLAGTWSLTPESSIAVALAFFALAAVGLAISTRWVASLAFQGFAFTVATCAYVLAVCTGGFHVLQDSVVLGLLALVAVAGLPVAVAIGGAKSRDAIVAAAGSFLGFFAMRFAYIFADPPHSGVSPELAVALTGALVSVIASVWTLFKKDDAASFVAWLMFASSGAIYLNPGNSPIGVGADMAITSGLLAAFAFSCAAVRALAARRPETWHWLALLGWFVFNRWVDVGFVWAGVDLHGFSSMTVAWIVYALALLSLGFSLRARELRYWSFAVMFATVGKILLVDLASTSTPFRVGVLLGLGVLMLAGGYWYVRGRHTPPAATA